MIETCSWQMLGHLRKRGQRPSGGLFVTDHTLQRRHLELGGLFTVMLPADEAAYLAAGLEVVLIADRNERSIHAAQCIASAHPSYFATYWRDHGLEVVLT